MDRKSRVRFGCLMFSAAFFCLLLFPSAVLGNSEKKYPPYPDKWLFEFDFKWFYKHISCVSAVRMENGDILLMYDKYKGKLLFEDKEFEVDPMEYREFCKKYKKRKIEYLFGAKLSDGTRIHKWGESRECYDINPNALYFNNEGKYYWIVKILSKPRKITDFSRFCEWGGNVKTDYLLERFDTPTNDIIPLEDNTFLVFLSIYSIDDGYDGKYIVRFDKNMRTKANIFNRKEYYIFDILDFIDWEKEHEVDYVSHPLIYSVQTRIDNIMEYIKTLK